MAWDLPSAADREMEEVPISGDNTRMLSFGTDRPHFAPPLLVDVLSDGRVAVVDSIGYRIKLLSSGGLVESVLERAILPRNVTPDVEQAVRDAMEAELTAGDAEESVKITAYGSLGIDKETIDAALRHVLETNLRQLTFAAQIPVIEAMGVDSEDRIWVSRTGNDGASDGPTDVFSADGQLPGHVGPGSDSHSNGIWSRRPDGVCGNGRSGHSRRPCGTALAPRNAACRRTRLTGPEALEAQPAGDREIGHDRLLCIGGIGGLQGRRGTRFGCPHSGRDRGSIRRGRRRFRRGMGVVQPD